MALSIGTEAPQFELPLKVGEAPLRLSDYRGDRNVVLLFFPLAFSSTCTREMCQMAEEYSEWSGLDAEIVGVSVDSAFVNQKFAAEVGADFPILSDFNKEASAAYDVLYDEFIGMKGVSKRAAFVIDKQGVISYAWSTDNAGDYPPFAEIRAAVAATN